MGDLAHTLQWPAIAIVQNEAEFFAIPEQSDSDDYRKHMHLLLPPLSSLPSSPPNLLLDPTMAIHLGSRNARISNNNPVRNHITP